MTSNERFNSWWKNRQNYRMNPSPDPFAFEGFEAGYTRGMSDARAMRVRCKQCADVIKDGSGLTGSVKRKLADAYSVIEELKKEVKVCGADSRRFQEWFIQADKARSLMEESLRVHKENTPTSANLIATWWIFVPELNEEWKFFGTCLEAIEYFTARIRMLYIGKNESTSLIPDAIPGAGSAPPPAL